MESKVIIHDHEQRTPAWYACRRGKLTGSNALTIATAGKGLETYCYEVLAEKYADIPQEDGYISPAMQRGIDLEPDAKTLFEFKTGKKVREVGFIEFNEFIGASPDGLIEDEKAVVEVKCHENKTFFMLMVHGVSAIKKEYLYQIQMEMLCAQYDKGYYVAYNPNFKESLLIFEIAKSDKIQSDIMLGCQDGIKIMQDIESKLLPSKE